MNELGYRCDLYMYVESRGPVPACASMCRCLSPACVFIHLQVSAGGLVRDPDVHKAVIDAILQAYTARGFTSKGCIPSPIKGANAGNTEFLAHLVFTQ